MPGFDLRRPGRLAAAAVLAISLPALAWAGSGAITTPPEGPRPVVLDPWVALPSDSPGPAVGSEDAPVFMRLTVTGTETDALVGVASDVSRGADLLRIRRGGTVEALAALPLAPGDTVEVAPGPGPRVVLRDVGELQVGQAVSLTLRFRTGAVHTVEARVREHPPRGPATGG